MIIEITFFIIYFRIILKIIFYKVKKVSKIFIFVNNGNKTLVAKYIKIKNISNTNKLQIDGIKKDIIFYLHANGKKNKFFIINYNLTLAINFKYVIIISGKFVQLVEQRS